MAATEAHCAFCFETLAAHLEYREALTLSQVEILWNKYKAGPDDAELAVEAEASESELEEAPIPSPADPSYRPAAISRLLANTPSTASSSSVQSTSSTPSGISDASSATSKSSSRSSIFSSLAGRLRERAKVQYPLFVTYNVLKHGEKRLRGCIGTFEPHDLENGLTSYALTSALEDTRFRPISTRELPTLECGVTLLTDFEPVSDPMDWMIGKHGLRISFTYHNRRYGATYLPDVAKEQGWTKEETLISLMRKAGWSGKIDEWKKVSLNVVRYQGSKAKLEYGEFLEWKEWVEELGTV